MTKRLYYTDPSLCEFKATVAEVVPASSAQERPQVVLDETAFYPTSGGQIYDTGWLKAASDENVRVMEVAEREDGRIVHYLEAPSKLVVGDSVQGVVDRERRRDHMQQHSGQHVLSAAFIELYQMPTVSFHMGDDYCSIDLTSDLIRPEQVTEVEKLSQQGTPLPGAPDEHDHDEPGHVHGPDCDHDH